MSLHAAPCIPGAVSLHLGTYRQAAPATRYSQPEPCACQVNQAPPPLHPHPPKQPLLPISTSHPQSHPRQTRPGQMPHITCLCMPIVTHQSLTSHISAMPWPFATKLGEHAPQSRRIQMTVYLGLEGRIWLGTGRNWMQLDASFLLSRYRPNLAFWRVRYGHLKLAHAPWWGMVAHHAPSAGSPEYDWTRHGQTWSQDCV